MKNLIKNLSFVFALGALFVSTHAFAGCGAYVANISATQIGTTYSYELSLGYDNGGSIYIKPQIHLDDNSSFTTGTYYPSTANMYSSPGVLKQTVSVIPGKTYYFRGEATTFSCGIVSDPNAISFTVPFAALPGATNVTTIGTSNLTQTSVDVSGNFSTTAGSPTDVYFEYGLNKSYNNKTKVQSIAGSGTNFYETISLSNFKGGDKVYIRAVAGPAHDSSSLYVTVPKPAVYQCNDGIDNDGDGYIDYPNDPACTSATDNDESPKNNTPTIVYGCTDSRASNYNSKATNDDGSCKFTSTVVYGCIDSSALNYNLNATIDDGSCVYKNPAGTLGGCLDPVALNYNPSATYSNGSCMYQNNYVYGCTVPSATNFNPNATINNGSCLFIVNNGGNTGGVPTISKPVAVTLLAKSATKTTAVIAGVVYAPNTSVNVYFEVFDSNNVLIKTTPSQNLSVSGSSQYSYALTNLSPNSVYYYRLVANNYQGTSVGDKMFVQTQESGSTKTTVRSGPVKTDSKSTSTASEFGASALFGHGFFPASFIGWLILIIIILFIIVIARAFFLKKKD